MPGSKTQEGLYYYYHTFAKALLAWGESKVTDAAGVAHDWRGDLCAALLRRQRADGSWLNEADRGTRAAPIWSPRKPSSQCRRLCLSRPRGMPRRRSPSESVRITPVQPLTNALRSRSRVASASPRSLTLANGRLL
jgi:hypothetical protein